MTHDPHADPIIPLLPAQAGFFLDVHHQLTNPATFNLNLMLEIDPAITLEVVKEAVSRAWRRHGALRARFCQVSGGWHQHLADTEAAVPFRAIDLSALPAPDQEVAVNASALQHQYSMNVHEGPLVQFLWYYYGPGSRTDLLVVFHHLVCDAFSRSVIEDEISSDLEAAVSGRSIERRPYSFEACTRSIDDYARSPAVTDTLPTWLEELSRRRGEAAMVGPDTYGHDSVSHVRQLPLKFAPELVAKLATPPFTFSPPPREVLLGLVADSLTKEFAGDILLQVVVDGRTVRTSNGRRVPLVPLDSLGAVGWFACESEVFAPYVDREVPVEEYQSLLTERNSRFPDAGLSFSLLRHIAAVDEIEKQVLLAHRGPQVWFNHVSTPYAASAQTKATTVVQKSNHQFNFALGPVVDPFFSGTPLAIELRSGYSRLFGWLTYDTAYFTESQMASLAGRITNGPTL